MNAIPPLPEEARAAEARARLTGSIGALQARLAPKTLAQNVVQGLVDKGQAAAQTGLDTAKKYPAALAGAVAALGLLFARKPIARLFARKHDTDISPKPRASKRNAE